MLAFEQPANIELIRPTEQRLLLHARGTKYIHIRAKINREYLAREGDDRRRRDSRVCIE